MQIFKKSILHFGLVKPNPIYIIQNFICTQNSNSSEKNSDPKKPEIPKVFHSYVLFGMIQDPTKIKKNVRIKFALTVLQTIATITVLVMDFPVVAFVMGLFTVKSINNLVLVRMNNKLLVTKIELVEDFEHVKLYFDFKKINHHIVVPISKISLLHTSQTFEWNSIGKPKKSDFEQNAKEEFKKYYLVLDAIDVNGETHQWLLFTFNNDCHYENLEMLQEIFLNNLPALKKFVYEEKKVESSKL